MINTYITTVQFYIGLAVTGIFTGIGSALGNYLANKHIIENMSKLKKIMEVNKNGTR